MSDTFGYTPQPYVPALLGEAPATQEAKPEAVTTMPDFEAKLTAIKDEIETHMQKLLASDGHSAALAAQKLLQVAEHLRLAIHVKSSLDAILKAI